ncbi:MAG: VCBS repeat-containing protein [Phycisphaeraceae bacterium]|nr:VCBS repeat-containing protein [Phycisphaeraceae bacterium]
MIRTMTLAALLASAAAGQDLTVVSLDPPARALTASTSSTISVEFDRPIDPATIDGFSFAAFGRWSGPVAGTHSVSPDGRTVTLTPSRSLSAGEQVMVILSHDIAALDGTPLRASGYSWQFWTGTAPADLIFRTRQTLTTRTTQGQGSRAYGAIGTDLDLDGWLDLSVINEDTADLRVFMNRDEGWYDPFLTPPAPLGNRASPNEPADFNRDGLPDICVANINVNTISVLFGNGDGTFTPSQAIPVGNAPRGVAVLDVDGDGDADIVNTNSGSSNLSLLINNGAGIFAAPVFFEGGDTNEWALCAADMDEDGLLDLVIGARSPQRILIQRNNGDGTFSLLSSTACGGSVWMVNAADVNGDGHDDVACANSTSNNGAILLGDGAGHLGAAATFPSDPFSLATDLGDLDGDGDLDWVLSAFTGDWFVLTNDGTGTFAFDQELDAPQAASCAILLDVDNDADLDLAMIDELEDVLIIAINACPADLSGSDNPGDERFGAPDGAVDSRDFFYFLDRFVAGDLDVADIDDDGDLDGDDFFGFLDLFAQGC